MLTFSPLESLTGGALLFLASSSYLVLNGEVFGVTGIIENAFHAKGQTRQSAWMVLAGFGLGGVVSRVVLNPTFANGSNLVESTSLWVPALAGTIVGLGTRLGSGCTSGHLLCGASRGSRRSILASMTFSATAMITTFLFRTNHRQPVTYLPPTYAMLQSSSYLLILAAANFELIRRLGNSLSKQYHPALSALASFSTGFWFSLGLSLSGMLSSDKILAFLDISSFATWDPSLIMLFFGGFIPNMLMYRFYIKNTKRPVLRDAYCYVTARDINWKLIVGSAIFGVGWGWLGVCPGPGFVNLTAAPSWKVAAFAGGWWVGMEGNRLLF